MTVFFRKSLERSGGANGSVSPPPPPEAGENGQERAYKPKLGLALGAGAARGWSHIGVLRELAAHGIRPDIVVGTSIGAVVGGCYVAGKLDQVEAFSRGLSKRRVLSLMDVNFSGLSLISGDRLKASLEFEVGGLQIEDMPISFAAVATEVGSGHEVWLKRGSLALAIRASYALPGILKPVRVGERWLFDGALVNPIPVTVCRALGAEFVIAVNVAADAMYRSRVIQDHHSTDEPHASHPFPPRPEGAPEEHLLPRFLDRRGREQPNVATAMIDAFNIIQDRILRSRMAGDPPDAVIHARHDDVGMFDFHRAAELIEVGHEATRRALPNIFAHIPLGATATNSD